MSLKPLSKTMQTKRFGLARIAFVMASISLGLALLMFCSCQAPGIKPGSSLDKEAFAKDPASKMDKGKISKAPFAENAPKTKEEEEYYRDVYSGDWQEQTGPFGMMKSICRKNGTSQVPPHWNMMPPGAKTMQEIYQENAAREMQQQAMMNSMPANPGNGQAPVYQMADQRAMNMPGQSYQVPAPNIPAQTVPYQPQNVPFRTYQHGTSMPIPQTSPVPQQTDIQQPKPEQQTNQPSYYYGMNAAPAVNNTVPAANSVMPNGSSANTMPQVVDIPVANRPANTNTTGQYPVQQNPVQQTNAIPGAPNSAYTVPVATPPQNTVPQAVPPVQTPFPQYNGTPVSSLPNMERNVGNSDLSSPGLIIRGQMPDGKRPIKIDPKIADAWKDLRQAPGPRKASGLPDDKRYPSNEYIADGGDSKGEAYSTPDWNVHHLDEEDTVAHFDTLGGAILTEPSNRIHIYSPRFGSVRQVMGLRENEQSVMLQKTELNLNTYSNRKLEGIDVRSQEEKTNSTRAKVDLAGMAATDIGNITNARVNVMENTLETRIGDMVAKLKSSSLTDQDATFLMAGKTAASAWSDKQGVTVEIDNVIAATNVYNKGVESIFHVENGTKTSKLRLIKIASKDAAQPGELVEFTLRFENMGNQPIGNVTLLDNLSARLAYVPNSAKASLKADFIVKNNEQGSLVLRWEITEPIKPGQFGVIQFLCKVL